MSPVALAAIAILIVVLAGFGGYIAWTIRNKRKVHSNDQEPAQTLPPPEPDVALSPEDLARFAENRLVGEGIGYQGREFVGFTCEEPEPELQLDTVFKVSAVLTFDYRDVQGRRTTRTVMVREFGEGGSGRLLSGFCRLRGEVRNFRISRMSGCFDAESGEVVENVWSFLVARVGGWG